MVREPFLIPNMKVLNTVISRDLLFLCFSSQCLMNNEMLYPVATNIKINH